MTGTLVSWPGETPIAVRPNEKSNKVTGSASGEEEWECIPCGRNICAVQQGDTNTEEGREVFAKKIVKGPTKEEWEEHMITHVPYRNWCK